MTWGLSYILALTMLFWQAPVLEGVATFYAEPYIGRTMQNGGTYTSTEMTAAVSADRWGELAGARLLVCTDARCVLVTVTDTGDAAEFAEHGVVLDLSVAAFRALVGPLGVGVVEVEAWRVTEWHKN